jgi:hypothetical protein
MTSKENRDRAASENCPDAAISKIYFSCPKFTVLLAVKGRIIVKAAPIVKIFEGQTVGTLSSWARKKFGGPIVVKTLSCPKGD